jgi:hypothetical protein
MGGQLTTRRYRSIHEVITWEKRKKSPANILLVRGAGAARDLRVVELCLIDIFHIDTIHIHHPPSNHPS